MHGGLIKASILETTGKTPLVRLNKLTKDLEAEVCVKLESSNPGGSVKDRIGVAMVEDAESKGLLKPGSTIVEPTAGNTGVGLALAAAVKGYRMIFVIPDKMSKEKVALLKAYGADIRMTRTAVAADSPEYYVNKAKAICKSIPGAFMPNQFENLANPQAHYRTTGPEIWEQTGGHIDFFVAGMGTGGTISGVAKALKEKSRFVKIVGVDPVGSVYCDYKKKGVMINPGPYNVEGIGEEFIPKTIDMSLIDDIMTVADNDAFMTARALARDEGILVGGSAGCAVFAALSIARDLGNAAKGKRIVALAPDTGRNYLSKIFSDEWMKENGYL